MYTFKIGIPAEVHDTFVKNHPLCNLLQSSSWAKVKDNWGSEIVGVYEKGYISCIKFSFNQTITSRFYDVIYTKRSSNGLYK